MQHISHKRKWSSIIPASWYPQTCVNPSFWVGTDYPTESIWWNMIKSRVWIWWLGFRCNDIHIFVRFSLALALVLRMPTWQGTGMGSWPMASKKFNFYPCGTTHEKTTMWVCSGAGSSLVEFWMRPQPRKTHLPWSLWGMGRCAKRGILKSLTWKHSKTWECFVRSR